MVSDKLGDGSELLLLGDADLTVVKLSDAVVFDGERVSLVVKNTH